MSILCEAGTVIFGGASEEAEKHENKTPRGSVDLHVPTTLPLRFISSMVFNNLNRRSKKSPAHL
jgi:hypothetical protein